MTRLEEIEARVNAAAAGPWSETDDYIQKVEPLWEVSQDAIAHDVMCDEDRIFIAHAREDVPWLLATIQRLRDGLTCLCSFDHEADCPLSDPELA